MKEAYLNVSTKKLVKFFIVNSLMVAFTCGLAFPVFIVHLADLLSENTEFRGIHKISHTLTIKGIYLWFLKQLGWTIITLGLYSLVFPYFALRKLLEHITFIIRKGDGFETYEFLIDKSIGKGIGKGLLMFLRGLLCIISLGFATPYVIIATLKNLFEDIDKTPKEKQNLAYINLKLIDDFEKRDQFVRSYFITKVLTFVTLTLYIFNAMKEVYNSLMENLEFRTLKLLPSENYVPYALKEEDEEGNDDKNKKSSEDKKEAVVLKVVYEDDPNSPIVANKNITHLLEGNLVKIKIACKTTEGEEIEAGKVLKFVNWSDEKKTAFVREMRTQKSYEVPPEIIERF